MARERAWVRSRCKRRERWGQLSLEELRGEECVLQIINIQKKKKRTQNTTLWNAIIEWHCSGVFVL